jgi:HK97 family phage prohead protease
MLGCKYDDITKYVHIHHNNAGSYTSYIPLYELTLKPMIDRNVVRMNDNIPLHILGNIGTIQKADDGERIIAGYASIIEVDKENHIIPKETLENGIQTLLKDSDYANLMLIHKNIQIGKIVKEWGDLKTHVDDKGLFIVAKIRTDLETANEVWQAIKSRKLNAFSIAGEIILAHEECDSKSCVRIIDKLNIYEVSVCDCPVNEKSGFVIVSKGEGSWDVLDKCIQKGEIMTEAKKAEELKKDCECPEEIKKSEEPVKKEEVKKTKDEEKNDEPVEEEKKGEEEVIIEPQEEASEETLIEALERRISALEGAIQELAADPEKELDEEEEEMDEEEEELEEAKPEEEEEEEPNEYPYPSKKDFDELKNAFDELKKGLDKSEDVTKLETLMKSKDDEISALQKKVETLEKAEMPPQTTTKVEDPPEEEEKEEDVIDTTLTKDSLGTGVWYKSPD